LDLPHLLEDVIRKFERRAPLDDSDRVALRALPFTSKLAKPHDVLVHEGRAPDVSSLILSGFAVRQKLTADGRRQIVSFHLAGDFVDLESAMLRCTDHNIQALTQLEYATVPVRAVLDLIDTHPRIARALWVDTLVDAAIYREWVLNVGRRSAFERIGHLLCEFARRLEIAGLGTTTGYRFPMTQEQLADAVGLTPIHVNRTLRAMDEQGLIRRHQRFIEIPNWELLRRTSDFSETYLHLDQAGTPAPPAHSTCTLGSDFVPSISSVSAHTSASARSGLRPGPA
jgi:CRP-like cAMP-binding protein